MTAEETLALWRERARLASKRARDKKRGGPPVPKTKMTKEERNERRRAKYKRKREEAGFILKVPLTEEERKASRRRQRLRKKERTETGEHLRALIAKARMKVAKANTELTRAKERKEKCKCELDRLLGIQQKSYLLRENAKTTKLPGYGDSNKAKDITATRKLDDAVFEATGFRMPKDWGTVPKSSAQAGIDWLAENTKPKPDTLAQ